METLIYNSASFLSIALGQYGKAFDLSATLVACKPLVLIPHLIAVHSRAFSVLKHY